MHRSPRLARLSPAFVVLALAVPAAAEVRIVDPSGASGPATIQAAIDASSSGDAILVRSGSYDGFVIDAKSLFVGADLGAIVNVGGTVTVRNLAAGQTVVVTRLHVTGPTIQPAADTALRLSSNAGQVRIQKCDIEGGHAYPLDLASCYGSGLGAPGADLFYNHSVVFEHCTLTGGDGEGDPGCLDCYGGYGGDGVNARLSSVALYDCSVRGGNGARAAVASGDGGDGYDAPGGGLFASHCTFRGGDADLVMCGGLHGGDGGHGIHHGTFALVHLLDVTTVGGAAGPGSTPGTPGQGIFGTGSVNTFTGVARSASAPVLGADGATIQVAVVGTPGDRVWLATAWRTEMLFRFAQAGMWLVPFPPRLTLDPAGTIGASGTLSIPWTLALQSGVDHATLHAQTFVVDAQGVAQISAPLQVLVLRCAAIVPDCNGNGSFDTCDRLFGLSADCDSNQLPDECQSDCNANGVADTCDLAGGTSTDCNADAIPDECEMLADCDGNGQNDYCDVLSGLAGDCDADWIPDACQPFVDCNGNGTRDACDVGTGTSTDVNADGVPDECQTGGRTLYVDASAPSGGDGTSAHPYRSIREGVEHTLALDTVVVLDGLYSGSQNREIGFAGKDIVVRSANGAAGCTIDCEGNGRAFRFLSTHEPATALVEGFTIVNGRSTEAPGYGGGIRIEYSDVTVSNCVIRNCTASYRGGGVYAGETRSRIVGCTIEDCRTTGTGHMGGGGVFIAGSYDFFDPGLEDCIVRRCESNEGGGVAFLGARRGHVVRCRIQGNSAQNGGGLHAGVFRQLAGDPGLAVEDCEITNNTAQNAAAIWVFSTTAYYGACTLVLSSSTIAHNSAGARGGGVYGLSYCEVHVRDTILWSNTAPQGHELAFQSAWTHEIVRCDVQGGSAEMYVGGGATVTWGAGNVSADPLFRDPDGLDGDLATFDDNDLRLAAGSPCIDAGANALAGASALDLDRLPRFVDDPTAPDTGAGTPPIVDIGAYERRP